jgi:hypothetical protein
MMSHAEAARSIDRHFAGTISAEKERLMRLHLPSCSLCETRYQRHLLLAALDRRVPSARRRLARGLGLPVLAVRRVWPVRALLAVTVLAAVALFARPHHGARGQRIEAFEARGDTKQGGFLWVYRLRYSQSPHLAEDHLAPGDELAFAYANPSGKRYLAVFGADEHGHVYWYYPGWRVGTRPPEPFHVRPGVGPYELTEAIRQTLDGRHLDLYAVFSDEPLSVGALERAIAAPGGLSQMVQDNGAVIVKRSFEVR